jgi:hypothetical protein
MEIKKMGTVEDVRKPMQDFLAPELRALTVRMDALEDKVDSNERRAEKRHEEVMANFRQVLDYAMVQQRLAALESEVKSRTAA